jgi:hypothetical protein
MSKIHFQINSKLEPSFKRQHKFRLSEKELFCTTTELLTLSSVHSTKQTFKPITYFLELNVLLCLFVFVFQD